MSDDIRVGIQADTNFPTVVGQITRSLDKLQNNFGDLADLLQDMVKSQNQFGTASAQAGQSAQGAAKGVGELNKSLNDSASAQASQKALEGYTKTVNDLRSVMGMDARAADFFPDVSSAAQEIKQLEVELVSLVNTYREGFGRGQFEEAFTTEGAIAELRKLQSELTQRARLEVGIDFNLDEPNAQLRAFTENLNRANAVGIQPTNAEVALSQFTEIRARGNELALEAQNIQNEIAKIGPAAAAGGSEATGQMNELIGSLTRVQEEAQNVGRELGGAFQEFERQTAGINVSLEGLGFKPVSMEDIFPTTEQQKVTQFQQRLDAVVRDSVQEGAVRNTLNAFLNSNAQIETMSKNVVGLTSHLPRLRYALYDVSNTLGVMGAALTGISVGAAKVAVDFQRMFADVERTVTGSTEQIGQLQKDLVALSQTIPVSFEEITRIATLAGQLNIATNRVAEFTETVAKFVATSDVTVEAAATAFGRLDQLVAGVDGQFERLGAAISAVGINAVATESEIIAISTQIASIANIAGFGAGELVGFASALASVGTRPELARGTFTRLFTEISQAAAGTKDTLGEFSRLAGRSAQDFTDAWGRGEGPELVIDFLKGLQAEGRNAELALREVGITSVRDVPTLLKLAQGVEEVEKQLAIAQIAFIEGTELQRQYSIVASTVAEKLQVLGNSFKALVSTIGSAAGSLGFVVDIFVGLLTVIQKILDNPINRFIVGITLALIGVVGAAGLVGAALVRTAAGFAGLVTASIETSEAVAFTRLNIQGLNADLATTPAAAAKAGTAMKGFGSVAKSSSTMAATGSKGMSVAAWQAEKSNQGLIRSIFGIGKATKIAPLAAFAGKFIAIYAGVLLLTAGIDALGKRFGLWGEEIENVNKKFGDLTPLLSAVRRDTENFNSGVTESAEGLIFFRGEVESSNVELSERGKVIAIVTGQEELLEQAVDGSSTALKNQTLVIGENTLALIKQKIAQDLVNESQRVSAQRIRQLRDIAEGRAPGTRDFGVDEARASLERQSGEFGIASIFSIVSDPALNAALQEAGFNISQFFDEVARGNEAAANSMLNNLVPAAEELREQLLNTGLDEAADKIVFLDTIIDFGADTLGEYVSAGSELQEAIRALVFEQAIMGEAFDDTSDSIEDFRDALKGAFDDAYYMVNAERALEESINNLGAAFAENEASIVASGSEIQTVIDNIIDSSSNTDEAIDGLSGLYTALVEGGFASVDQLRILRDEIVKLKRELIDAEIEFLQSERRTILSAESRFGSPAAVNTQKILENNRAIAEAQARRDSLEKSIAASTETTLYYTEQLNRGVRSVEQATRGSAAATREVADNTRDAAEEVRTLLDYASDLDRVIKRAFDLRFKASLQVDKVADSWDGLRDNVRNAQEAIEDLIRSQRDLAADRAIKEYFLSIAEAYNDQLRASKLRAEISELDAKAAENQRKLVEQGFIGDIDTGEANLFELEDDSSIARRNRAALGGLVREYQDYIIALAESGASQDELRKATERARKEFIAQATDLGFSEAAVEKYASAFDDLTFAINNIPRNVTIEADVNPALTALRELQAQQIRNIELANDLNRAMGQTPSGSGTSRPPSSLTPQPSVDIASLRRAREQYLADVLRIRNQIGAHNLDRALFNRLGRAAEWQRTADRLQSQLRAAQTSLGSIDSQLRAAGAQFAQGGFTGRGGKFEPAGIVHKGEFVVPKEYVDQTTGRPDMAFLAMLQSGMAGYSQGGLVGGGGVSFPNAMMVELSPYDRQLLEQAGNVQLRLDGRVVAQATNRNSVSASQRGSN